MAPKKKYAPLQMVHALEAVKRGEKIARAAEKFGVPRITLYNKFSGKSPVECSMGPNTYLSKSEENILETWITTMSERHIPISKDELLDSVQRIITDKKVKTPFINNRPGKKWYSLFLKRHPQIAERTAQNLTTPRDNVTENDIIAWFSEVEKYLKDKKLTDILKHPERIFNTDESAFFLSPKPGKVLAKRGDKHVYQASGPEKDNLTVLVTGNAAGELAPTMVVYCYERIPSAIASNFPEPWAIGRSDTGWMCSSTFYEYIANIFNPWLTDNNISRPVLLFLDGHKSHLTLHLSNFCIANQIEIVALHPNSTHILQPMDLAVFRPLKSLWRKAVSEFKLKNQGQNLRKDQFAPLLKTAIDALTKDSIKNGFRAGGIYPFGPEYVNMSKIKSTQRTDPTSTLKISQKDFLSVLEEHIEDLSSDKLGMFQELYYRNRDELEKCLPDEDISLYLIWAKVKHTIYDTDDDNQESSMTASSIDKTNVSQNPELDQTAATVISKIIVTEPPSLDERTGHFTDAVSDIIPLNNSLAISTVSDKDIDHTTTALSEVMTVKIPAVRSSLRNEDVNCIAARVVECEVTPTKRPTNRPAPLIEGLDSTITHESEVTPLKTFVIRKNDHAVTNTSKPGSCNADELSSKKSLLSRGGLIIPSPFKRNLYWPEDNDNKVKKRRLKEKMPSVCTGEPWRKYHQKIETEKKRKLEEKETRARERQEKKFLKEKLMEEKKKNKNKKQTKRKMSKSSKADDNDDSYDESEIESDVEIAYAESDDSLNSDLGIDSDPLHLDADSDQENMLWTGQRLKKGCYVIVQYEGQHFPGIIENVNDVYFEVSTMTFSTGNTFKWPDKPDKIWYKKNDVVEVIDRPVSCNKRGFFTIKEMKKYLTFTS